jgi:hypothetical protein
MDHPTSQANLGCRQISRGALENPNGCCAIGWMTKKDHAI